MPARLQVLARPARAAASATFVLAAVTATGAVAAAPASASPAPAPASTAIGYALNHLGTPYVYGGTGPSGYDCSGLTVMSYRAAGITLPRVSRDQYNLGAKVPLSQLQPGDLVFWGTSSSWSSVYHVAIAVSKWTVIEAPRTGLTVRVAPMYRPNLMPYAVRPGGLGASLVLNPWPATSGMGVLDIQSRLRANGYSVSKTGYYDGATRSAVRSFQARYGTSVDAGTVQWRTWSALFAHGASTSLS